MSNLQVPPPVPQGGGSAPAPTFNPAALTPCRLVSGNASLPLSSAAPVTWHMKPGVAPVRAEFTVVAPRAEAWLGRVGREFIKLEWDGRVFENLRVIRSNQVNPWHVAITVVDRRYEWRNYRFHGRINLRRRSGVLTLFSGLVEDSPEAGGTNLGIDAKRDDLTGVAEEVYREWSVKTDGTPYTALELLILIIRALHEELDEREAFDASAASTLDDNGEIVDQQEYLGDSYPDIIGALLQKAEVALAVDQDGSVRLYSPFAPLVLPDAKIKGGAFRVPSLDRIRPKHIEVRAIPEQELRGVYNTAAQLPNVANALPDAGRGADADAQEPDNTFALQNVVRLNFPVAVGNVEHQAGEYILMDDLTEALGFWTDEDIRKGWMFGGWGLREKFARRRGGGVAYYDPIVMGHIASVLDGYRQLWRIDPAVMNRIRSWLPKMVALIHPESHTRQKSVVFSEWANILPALPLLQRRGEEGAFVQNYSSFLTRDARGELNVPLSKANQSTAPFELTQVDPDQGIMRTTPISAFDGGVAERIPSKLDPEAAAVRTAVRKLTFFNLNIGLAPDHRMEVVISAIMGTPNATELEPLAGKRAYFLKTYTNTLVPDGGEALTPRLQLMVRGDTARITEDNELVNRNQIEALMKAAALSSARSFLDRPLGVLTVQHDPAARWKLSGYLVGLTFSRSMNGRDSVTVNAGEPPPEEKPVKFLPQGVKQFLFKVLSGTDALASEE